MPPQESVISLTPSTDDSSSKRKQSKEYSIAIFLSTLTYNKRAGKKNDLSNNHLIKENKPERYKELMDKPYCEGETVRKRSQCGDWSGGAFGGESELKSGKRGWHNHELEVTHGSSLLSLMNPFWVFLVTLQMSESEGRNVKSENKVKKGKKERCSLCFKGVKKSREGDALKRRVLLHRNACKVFGVFHNCPRLGSLCPVFYCIKLTIILKII